MLILGALGQAAACPEVFQGHSHKQLFLRRAAEICMGYCCKGWPSSDATVQPFGSPVTKINKNALA